MIRPTCHGSWRPCGRGPTWCTARGGRPAFSFRTPFGKPITAPVAVADGRIYFGSDDGYLYVLGPGGRAPLPEQDLERVLLVANK